MGHALTNIANTVIHVRPAKIGLTGHAGAVKVTVSNPPRAGTASSASNTSPTASVALRAADGIPDWVFGPERSDHYAGMMTEKQVKTTVMLLRD